MSFPNANNVYAAGATLSYVAGNQVNIHNATPGGHLPHAFSAAFESLDPEKLVRCLEGTRVDILDRVYRWIDVDDARSPNIDMTENPRIFWINGSAGTGKTTIAYTVAETCRKRGILGASFFCSRDYAERSNPNLIFATVAHQLGLFYPPFRVEVTRVLQLNPDLVYSSVPHQLEELIVKPLHAVGGSFPSCVIVLDALDECKDSGTTSIILSSLSRYIAELLPLKIMVTSRPEQNITMAFKSRQLGSAAQRLILHEIELGVVQHDIDRYLTSNLSLIREYYGLESSWPSEADIQALAVLSNGLFIFAATSVNFIQDRNYSSPRDQLADLLRNSVMVTESSSSPHHHLDRLYTQVLNHAFPDISPRLGARLKTVLGSIIFLQDPLSPLALERLLNLTPRTVQETLAHLQSVIIVPENDVQIIRLLHPSFVDFMTDPMRCQDAKFVVNAEAQHTLLACACLRTMRSLKQDICGIRNPSVLNSEVDDLPSRIMKCIPPHIQYACRRWALHLTNASLSDVLLDLVKEFCSKYHLYWVEVCSLLGELRDALIALHDAQQFLAKKGNGVTDVIAILHDCERFTREFFPILSTSSLQVYHSALLFTPRETLFYGTYGHKLALPMQTYNAVGKTWDLCMRTMDGHSGGVSSVAFSPDGTCIVSGSYDNTLRLWDAVSGAHLNTLKGHSNSVHSVAFSPDGTCIVSGSSDCTIRLWDAVSGAHLNTLKGHSTRVESVTFSPDGMHIVSGSSDKTLRLWNAVSGAHINTLEGHSSGVKSVTFSPDGIRIASGSWDTTLRLWDAISGAHLSTFKGHSTGIYSIAFSPDGTRIVSGSSDTTLRLWNAVSGAHLNTLMGHSGWIYSVAFSPDGTRIVSGSLDTTLRLWDAISGAHLNTFKEHSTGIYSVAFSPDGTCIVSGFFDTTLRLWDAISGAHLNPLKVHSMSVHSVAFSPDGTGTVSGSDSTPRIWGTVSSAHLTMLQRHSCRINSVAFSPDGTRIVSGSEDNTVRLWDAVSGTHLNTLQGHSSSIYLVAFSPDGTHIVSGSWDTTLRLWDAVSGAHLNTLMGHSSCIDSVAFSPDGTRIVSGSLDTTLRLWDAISGAHLNTLMGHSLGVASVAFSPDGTRIVSGSYDGTIRLWDTVSGLHLDMLKGHASSAHSVAHSLNSQQSSFLQSSHISPSESHSTVGYTMDDDGWICSVNPNQRLFWIPVSCRPVYPASSRNRIALGTRDGRVVILDLTGLDSYLQPLLRM